MHLKEWAGLGWAGLAAMKSRTSRSRQTRSFGPEPGAGFGNPADFSRTSRA
jgi:hypothetical protein